MVLDAGVYLVFLSITSASQLNSSYYTNICIGGLPWAAFWTSPLVTGGFPYPPLYVPSLLSPLGFSIILTTGT